MRIPRVVISAPHRSSGKTTMSIGLCSALRSIGTKVQSFKKGPDYIDPMWLSIASGRDCYNLDLFMMGEQNIVRSLQEASKEADISLVEGNMGLYDGIDIKGQGSTSDLARLLKAPVVLVVDTGNMTRSIAPLILGFKNFEPDISIAGIILNKVAGPRHESKLRAAIELYCDTEVIGSIPRLPEMQIIQRHLGLKPAKEDEKAVLTIDSIGNTIRNHIDLNRLIDIAKNSPSMPELDKRSQKITTPVVKIGVARDRAFTFYYPENIVALQEAGAEVVPFSPLNDRCLPDVNGLFIGGGFPEVFIKELEGNMEMRRQIREAIEDGMPVYAECGGLMYLARRLVWNDAAGDMVGSLPCDIVMHKKPKGHGYVKLQTTGRSWLNTEAEINAHEFHYSEVANLGEVDFAYKLLRGKGVDDSYDGIIYRNVLASYAHLHSLGAPFWAEQFVAFVKNTGFKFM